MKILITCGGGFQGQSLLCDLRFLKNAELHLADINKLHSNIFIADYCIVSPKVKEEKKYTNFLRDYVALNNIEYIIPATVFDLKILSKLKTEFRKNKCYVLVPDTDILEILDNKTRAYAFLKSYDIPTQDQLPYNKASSYPLIAKPNNGWGGLNIFRFRDLTEMKDGFTGKPEHYSWTKLVDDFHEFSIDFAVGPQGETGNCVYRLREKTTSGFAVQSLIIVNPPKKIASVGEKIQEVFSDQKFSGIYNVQVIQTNNQIFVSDINCRIGTSAVGSSIIQESLLHHLTELSKLKLISNIDYRFFRTLQTHFLPEIDCKKLNHIVFDLDDTLISNRQWIIDRTEILYFKCQEINKQIKLSEFLNWIDWQLTEGKSPILMDVVFEKFQPFKTKESLINEYRKCYPNKLKIYPDVLPTLKQLHDRGIAISLLSDNPVKTQKIKWSLFPSSILFKSLLFTNEINSEKPNRIVFDKICQISLKQASESVMVGNNLYRDIIGALDADFKLGFYIKRPDDLLAHGMNNNSTYKSQIVNLKNLTELLYYFN